MTIGNILTGFPEQDHRLRGFRACEGLSRFGASSTVARPRGPRVSHCQIPWPLAADGLAAVTKGLNMITRVMLCEESRRALAGLAHRNAVANVPSGLLTIGDASASSRKLGCHAGAC